MEYASLNQEELVNLLLERDLKIAALTAAVECVEDLIDSSSGVSGLHLNGDVANWSSLRTGGQFEAWLVDFDSALT
ncbi:hypothetical protein [Shewanella glacialipiscicola]|uniref:hypothetical protein n=1 Tax=Shewanella glacialipiscicola TaxID=614069 RepID=UPI003D78C5C7